MNEFKVLVGALAVLAFGAAPAAAADYVPGELLVQVGGGQEHVLKLPDQVGITAAAAALNANPQVSYAVPNYIASASSVWPNDPGHNSGHPGDWKKIQWNFLNSSVGNPGGVNAPGAWHNLSAPAIARPGARGIRIAVVDTGVAYRSLGKRYKRSPDFNRTKFGARHDFVEHDRIPLDKFGHGTHVAGTIAESTSNRRALTGLAYRSTILPVRVLNANGRGTASWVARGIRFAAHHNARVINLSLDFGSSLGKNQLPGVDKAIRYANNHGSIVVASAGNHAQGHLPYPAAANKVISVGATTKSGCLAEYSNRGNSATPLDIAAPGGGADADGFGECVPSSLDGPKIRQLTLRDSSCCRRFRIKGLQGTSQAAPHISAIAAMVIATRVVGSHPTAATLLQRLQETGVPVTGSFGNVRLVNAAAATAPTAP